jgi:hypothetical protein
MNVQGKEIQGQTLIDTNSPDNVNNMKQALIDSGFGKMCSASALQDIASACANAGLYLIYEGKPGPAGWTDMGRLSPQFHGWYKGPQNELNNKLQAIMQKAQQICNVNQGQK